jgi:O-antigen/teichoic acid export membrane protein
MVRVLAAPEFFESYEAIGLVSTGVMLYALYLVLVVVLGRTGRTEFNFPATAAGTAANIGLNLVFIPEFGIVGAGLSLVISYAVVLALMYVFTQRLFRVPYEWLRLGQALLLAAAIVAAGELLLPSDGLDGLASRTALWLLYPAVLWGTGFLSDEERRAAANNLSPAAIRAALRRLRESPPEETVAAEPEQPGRGPRLTRETLEAEQRDEDARP